MEPPGPIPNPEVKRCSANGSETIGLVRVGRRQVYARLQAIGAGLFFAREKPSKKRTASLGRGNGTHPQRNLETSSAIRDRASRSCFEIVLRDRASRSCFEPRLPNRCLFSNRVRRRGSRPLDWPPLAVFVTHSCVSLRSGRGSR